MLHTFVDPFAVDLDDVKAQERQRVRRTINVLNAEIDRLEARIDRLYHSQTALPEGEGPEQWDYWEDVYNTYQYRLDRLIARSDKMYETVWQLEERIYWDLS